MCSPLRALTIFNAQLGPWQQDLDSDDFVGHDKGATQELLHLVRFCNYA